MTTKFMIHEGLNLSRKDPVRADGSHMLEWPLLDRATGAPIPCIWYLYGSEVTFPDGREGLIGTSVGETHTFEWVYATEPTPRSLVQAAGWRAALTGRLRSWTEQLRTEMHNSSDPPEFARGVFRAWEARRSKLKIL